MLDKYYYYYSNLIWCIVSRRVNIFSGQSTTRDAERECGVLDLEISLNLIQCVRSSQCIDHLFITYHFLNIHSILNIITREHLTFFTAWLVTSSLVTSAASFEERVIRIQKMSVCLTFGRWQEHMKFKGCIIDRYIMKIIICTPDFENSLCCTYLWWRENMHPWLPWWGSAWPRMLWWLYCWSLSSGNRLWRLCIIMYCWDKLR